MDSFFQYGETELAWLRSRDKQLAEIIDRIGRVERRVIPDLFAALVHSIVGQQISTKAHETIWGRIEAAFGAITPDKILSLKDEELQSVGISFRKVTYIKRAAQKIASEWSCGKDKEEKQKAEDDYERDYYDIAG